MLEKAGLWQVSTSCLGGEQVPSGCLRPGCAGARRSRSRTANREPGGAQVQQGTPGLIIQGDFTAWTWAEATEKCPGKKPQKTLSGLTSPRCDSCRRGPLLSICQPGSVERRPASPGEDVLRGREQRRGHSALGQPRAGTPSVLGPAFCLCCAVQVFSTQRKSCRTKWIS